MKTSDAHGQFRRTKERLPELGRFEDPPGLLDYLNSKAGDLDEKDRIYAALIESVQARGSDAKLAASLILLGLWPGLDAAYRRLLRHFVEEPDELASKMAETFVACVNGADLRRIGRVAATLVRNVERDVKRSLPRTWQTENERADLPGDNKLGDASGPAGSRGPSELGLPPGLEPEEEAAALREVLVEVIGADADLFLGVAAYGFKLSELAVQLGIGHAAARKRYQRARERLRRWHDPK